MRFNRIIKTIDFDAIEVNVFHFSLKRFLFKKGLFHPHYTTNFVPGLEYWRFYNSDPTYITLSLEPMAKQSLSPHHHFLPNIHKDP